MDGGERRLEHDELSRRSHLVLRAYRQGREGPREYPEHERGLEAARDPRISRDIEEPRVGPREDRALHEHRRQPKREEQLLPIDLERVVSLLERGEMPEVAERKCRQDVRRYCPPELTRHGALPSSK